MFCDQCGSSVREGVRFCGACGAGVDVPAGVNVPVTSRVAPARSNTLLIVFGICILLVLIGGLVIGVMVLNKPTESVGSAREGGAILGMGPSSKNVLKEHLAEVENGYRAKVSTLMLAASGCRTAITETIQVIQRGPIPPQICQSAQNGYKVGALGVDGLIVVTAYPGYTGNAEIDERVITMMPLIDGKYRVSQAPMNSSGVVLWTCGSPQDLPPGLQMVAPRFLPASCRP